MGRRSLETGYRKSFEFDKQTKLEALRRADFRCESCGTAKRETREKYLEIHHQIAIGWYLIHEERFFFVSHAFMKSVQNAMCLCIDCHREIHAGESLEYYLDVANEIVSESPQMAFHFINQMSSE